MQYEYQILCASGATQPKTQPGDAPQEHLLFETFSCLLVGSRVVLGASLTPLKPLLSGALLSFRTAMPEDEVEEKIAQLISRCNQRLSAVTLVARRIACTPRWTTVEWPRQHLPQPAPRSSMALAQPVLQYSHSMG
jgi:hypothetical protein